MSSIAVLVLAAGVVAAFADWISVAGGDRRSEEIAKPLVLLSLILVAALLDPVSSVQRLLFVVALILSLVGDVALLPRSDRFVVGLGSFLLAHVAYVVGLLMTVDSWAMAPVGVLIVVVAMGTVGRKVTMAAESDLRAPVAAYMLALGLLVVAAFATQNAYFIAGSVLFLVSDSILGWGRFVDRTVVKGSEAATRFAVHSTYHLAQLLLVMGLVA